MYVPDRVIPHSLKVAVGVGWGGTLAQISYGHILS